MDPTEQAQIAALITALQQSQSNAGVSGGGVIGNGAASSGGLTDIGHGLPGLMDPKPPTGGPPLAFSPFNSVGYTAAGTAIVPGTANQNMPNIFDPNVSMANALQKTVPGAMPPPPPPQAPPPPPVDPNAVPPPPVDPNAALPPPSVDPNAVPPPPPVDPNAPPPVDPNAPPPGP